MPALLKGKLQIRPFSSGPPILVQQRLQPGPFLLTITSGSDDGMAPNGGALDDSSANGGTGITAANTTRRSWYRFASADFEPLATISSAILYLTSGVPSGAPELLVTAQAVDNASTNPADTATLFAYTTTVASTVLTPTTQTTYAVNVTAILQELVNRGGWVRGNGVMFLVDNTHVADSAAHVVTFGMTENATASNRPSLEVAVAAPPTAVPATFTTAAGDAPASGGSSTFTGDATFTTTVGNAPADGGSTTFAGGATFTTVVGDAPAAGGSTSFTGTAVFDTVVGDAPAAGGSTSFTVDVTFGTTVGDAPASGGSTTFTGGATFTTAAGDAPAAGGSTSFTGDGLFGTIEGVLTADGGSTTFAVSGAPVTFTTVVGVLTASGGTTEFLIPGAGLGGGDDESLPSRSAPHWTQPPLSVKHPFPRGPLSPR